MVTYVVNSQSPGYPSIHGYLGYFSGGKQPEADNSPLFSSEVKNDGAISPLPRKPSRRDA
jgi:hypothetical protein